MSPLDLVPKEYHLATIVGTSLIGFLLILVISSLTAKPIDSEPPADSDTSAEPKTPGKKKGLLLQHLKSEQARRLQHKNFKVENWELFQHLLESGH
mmetsp:Transcript_34501/g.50074  ORF Transcript_34501/g.50074 Transcript_34501/m.50074 type:complete len:96 (+) Transcript_34501:81-368(+)